MPKDRVAQCVDEPGVASGQFTRTTSATVFFVIDALCSPHFAIIGGGGADTTGTALRYRTMEPTDHA